MNKKQYRLFQNSLYIIDSTIRQTIYNTRNTHNQLMDIEYNPLALKYKDQGNVAYKSQQYNKAINLYTKAIQIQEDSSYYSNRALCYFNLNRFQQCIRDCDHAIELSPQISKAYKKKYQACLQLLKFEEAVQAAKTYASLEKNVSANNELQQVQSLKSNYDRYLVADRQNNYTEALSCISYLVNKIPSNKRLKFNKVQCLAKTGQTVQAGNVLNTMHNENTPEFYYLKGIIELYNGDSVKAKKFFAEGMRLDPQNAKCQRALNKAKKCEAFKEEGNELIKQKKYKEAQHKYTGALHLDPYNKKLNSIIYSNRALCYMKTGQKIKALQDLNKSLQLDPNYMKSLVRRAQILMEREDYSAALNDYSKIQELDPNINLKAKIADAQKKERLAKKKDYYAILGVSKKATDAQIKKAYKALALKFHPDRNRVKSEVEQEEASKKFKDIAQAHGVLTDTEKRKKYDCGQMEFDGDTGASGYQNMGEHMNFNRGNRGNMGNMGNMGNAGSMGNTKFSFNGNDMNGMGIDPNQLFSMFFNGRGGQQGFEGFGPSFGGNRGGNQQKPNTRASSKGKGFTGFGNFAQNGSNFNFA